jgi:hypothetical protein
VVLARCDAGLRGKGEFEEGRKTDEWVPLASERKEKGERCGLAGLRLQHGLGSWVGGKRRMRPRLVAIALQIV